jgi:drug/metabolite transporter (DMT)-like permease
VWVFVSLAAGSFQTARNGLARSLSLQLPAVVLSWARFAFNLPFSAGLVVVLALTTGEGPSLSGRFLLYCLVAGVAQLVANVALVESFRLATFAQAIVIHKSEVALTAVVGAVVFDEVPSPLGWVGVVVTGAGVAMISLSGSERAADWRAVLAANRGSGLALAAAFLLVIAGFTIKEATTELAAVNTSLEGTFRFAATTLFHVTWMEAVLLSGWLLARQRATLPAIRPHLGRLYAIGFTGFAGSLCWFWAFSLTLVAYVRAVGQVEAVLSVFLAIYVWHEHRTRRQLPGIAVTVLGILLIVLR